MTVDSLC